MDLNKAMIIGRLTRDPETRTTPQGTTVTSFGVATNFIWTDPQGQKQEKVEYHNVVAWRKLADICSQYLHKGSRVYIEGRLQTREWEGQDGVKRQRTEIIADNMIMLDAPGQPRSMAQDESELSANKEPEVQTEPASESAKQSQKESELEKVVSPAKPASEESKEEKKEEVKVEDIPF